MMIISRQITITDEDDNEIKAIRPIIFTNTLISFTISAIIMNLPRLSSIIWPNERFHALELGLLISAKTWGTAFSGLLFGVTADRYSRKRQYILIVLIIGLAYLMTGFIPEGQGNFSLMFFIIFQTITGVGIGGRDTIILSYINDAISERKRSQFFGINASFGQFSMALGMLVSAILMDIGLWRLYFWGTGAVIILGGIIVGVKISEPKRGAKTNYLEDIVKENDIEYDFRINKETLRKTMLSSTNVIALVEGIFTKTALGMTTYLLLPYLQIKKNISASNASIIFSIFGFPGVILGNLFFAKISDRAGVKDIRNRAKLISFSITLIVLLFILMFFVPIPYFDADQGKDLFYVINIPALWAIGALIFFQRAVKGIYDINQPPIIQKINLPEAQGKIMSWNQFLETIGRGFGPLIAGIILEKYLNDYMLTSFICFLIALPGAVLWFISIYRLPKDVQLIEDIIKKRSAYLKNKK